METNETMIASLLNNGKQMQEEVKAKQAEAKKLNENTEWFGFQALKRIESKKATDIFKANHIIAKVQVEYDAIKARLEETKGKQEPEAYAALQQLKAIQNALKAFVLKGEAQEVAGVQIDSLEAALRAYSGIKQRMVMEVRN